MSSPEQAESAPGSREEYDGDGSTAGGEAAIDVVLGGVAVYLLSRASSSDVQ